MKLLAGNSNRALAEAVAPGGHCALAAVAHRFHDGLGRAAVQPDPVGQIGSPQSRIALTTWAVTGRAGREARLAERGLHRIACRTGQTDDVVGDVLDVQRRRRDKMPETYFSAPMP